MFQTCGLLPGLPTLTLRDKHSLSFHPLHLLKSPSHLPKIPSIYPNFLSVIRPCFKETRDPFYHCSISFDSLSWHDTCCQQYDYFRESIVRSLLIYFPDMSTRTLVGSKRRSHWLGDCYSKVCLQTSINTKKTIMTGVSRLKGSLSRRNTNLLLFPFQSLWNEDSVEDFGRLKEIKFHESYGFWYETP